MTALSVAAVKGTRLRRVVEVVLDRRGAVGNREFFVIDERDRMVNAKQLGALETVVASYSPPNLALEFPDGAVVSDGVRLGAPVRARFFSRIVEGRLLEGPWAEALSAAVGQPVRIVAASGSVDRGPDGAVTLISQGSVERLAAAAGVGAVDSRRFRMLVEIDDAAAHEEDQWIGRSVHVGEAVVRFSGHVGRCLVTSRDPDTGCFDLPTLDILRDYRGHLETTEPLAFGVYGSVEQPGTVRVSDRVAPV